jgi:hypothetical protein
MEGGFVDARRRGEGYQKLKTEKRRNKQKLHERNLGPVRPSVRRYVLKKKPGTACKASNKTEKYDNPCQAQA